MRSGATVGRLYRVFHLVGSTVFARSGAIVGRLYRVFHLVGEHC